VRKKSLKNTQTKRQPARLGHLKLALATDWTATKYLVHKVDTNTRVSYCSYDTEKVQLTQLCRGLVYCVFLAAIDKLEHVCCVCVLAIDKLEKHVYDQTGEYTRQRQHASASMQASKQRSRETAFGMTSGA
jgi:hypothetical protein